MKAPHGEDRPLPPRSPGRDRTGAGRGFCAGLDLTGFGTVPGTEGQGRVQQGMATQQFIADVVHRMRDVRQPIIAAVNGAAAGGGFAFACASDVRYCGASAKFGTAFVRLGLSGCDIGVSWLLPRLIGASRAWELLLTGRVFDAQEADRIGLVRRPVRVVAPTSVNGFKGSCSVCAYGPSPLTMSIRKSSTAV